jgi:hypothetical protein
MISDIQPKNGETAIGRKKSQKILSRKSLFQNVWAEASGTKEAFELSLIIVRPSEAPLIKERGGIVKRGGKKGWLSGVGKINLKGILKEGILFALHSQPSARILREGKEHLEGSIRMEYQPTVLDFDLAEKHP